MQSYGHAAQGASCAQVSSMRANIKAGTTLGTTCACTTTAIAWIYGEYVDPYISIRVEQLATWIDLWVSYGSDVQSKLQNMWRKKLSAIICNRKHMWSLAKGPMTATICTLLEIGWKPTSPSRWFTGESWAMVGSASYSKAHILGQAQQDLKARLWSKAARHRNHGKGLETGAYLFAAKKARANLVKEGELLAVRALDYLVTGALGDPGVVDGKPRNEHFCHRCDRKVVATRYHELWECSGNSKILHAHMSKSDWTKKQARSNWEQYPCLYARGIVPGDWLKKPDEIGFLDAKTWESSNFKESLDLSGRAYSDGSGGPKDVPRSITQVAFGATSFCFKQGVGTDYSLDKVACIGGQVPGKQTVPRAELWGGIQTLIRAHPEWSVNLGIDASYVTRGVVNRGALANGENGDLWRLMFEIIDSRPGRTNIFKVKSHLEDEGPKAIQEGKINFVDLVGNSLADTKACH